MARTFRGQMAVVAERRHRSALENDIQGHVKPSVAVMPMAAERDIEKDQPG